MLTQALLGFQPDAPRNKLYVDPALPCWLPDLTVRNLRIGKHRLDIRFWTEGKQTAFEVIKGDPKVVERCDIASKIAQLRMGADSPPRPQPPAKRRGKRGSRARKAGPVRPRM